MSPSLWLISEDPSDAEIVKEILRKKSIPVNIEPVRMPNNMGGIFRLSQELPKLIETTKARRDSADRIAVLIDAEWYKPKHERRHHKQIIACCRQYRQDVKFLWAVQEIEAWILADSGICAWLEIEPEQTDQMRDPKEKLVSLLYQKKRRSWRSNDRKRVLQELRGDGDRNNSSLGRVLMYIETLRI